MEMFYVSKTTAILIFGAIFVYVGLQMWLYKLPSCCDRVGNCRQGRDCKFRKESNENY